MGTMLYLPPSSIFSLALTCKKFHNISRDPKFWQLLCERDANSRDEILKFWQQRVRESSGQLQFDWTIFYRKWIHPYRHTAFATSMQGAWFPQSGGLWALKEDPIGKSLSEEVCPKPKQRKPEMFTCGLNSVDIISIQIDLVVLSTLFRSQADVSATFLLCYFLTFLFRFSTWRRVCRGSVLRQI